MARRSACVSVGMCVDLSDHVALRPCARQLQSLGFTGEGRPALTDEEIEFLFSTTDRGTF